MHGGGSRGGLVASFTRTTSRHSSLQRHTPCAYPQSHAVGTDQCAIFRIVATVIDYFSLLVTACHRLFFTTCHCLSSTIYLSLPGACPRWKERASSRIIRWILKERASSRSRKHVFHPNEFYVHGSQVKVHPGARACGFRFRHQRTYAHTHTRTQPIVSI